MITIRSDKNILASSFRDPSGLVFYYNGSIYRQINISYKKNYDHLISSGFYKELVREKLLIPHKEVKIRGKNFKKVYKIIKPESIHFISYPYEWCFSQLKDAALITLKIQKRALEFGMMLKDANAYNIQFHKGKPILIDTLSFERYRLKGPWVAYKQFCQHFLGPLALISYNDGRLSQLFRIYLDGVSLDLVDKILPFCSRFKASLLLHLHLHAKSINCFANKSLNKKKVIRKVSQQSVLGLIDSLESAIKGLRWRLPKTEWVNYYENTNYSAMALEYKKKIVAHFLDTIKPKNTWDFGANTGLFSRIAAVKGIQTISFDTDPVCVEKNYLTCVERRETNILPLLFDLTNPSPGIGWENKERMTIFERGPTDAVLALALIHHLVIANNIPFDKLAEFFDHICRWLIIEFVPKEDLQVQELLSIRKDIFSDYKQQSFEKKFKKNFIIKKTIKIKDSPRVLYLMERKKS